MNRTDYRILQLFCKMLVESKFTNREIEEISDLSVTSQIESLFGVKLFDWQKVMLEEMLNGKDYRWRSFGKRGGLHLPSGELPGKDE